MATSTDNFTATFTRLQAQAQACTSTETFEKQLDLNGFSPTFQIVIQQFLEKRPDNEQLKASFIEHYAVIDRIGILAHATDVDMSSTRAVDILAIFLVGFFKGVNCTQVENHVPAVDARNCLKAWDSLQALSSYYHL